MKRPYDSTALVPFDNSVQPPNKKQVIQYSAFAPFSLVPDVENTRKNIFSTFDLQPYQTYSYLLNPIYQTPPPNVFQKLQMPEKELKPQQWWQILLGYDPNSLHPYGLNVFFTILNWLPFGTFIHWIYDLATVNFNKEEYTEEERLNEYDNVSMNLVTNIALSFVEIVFPELAIISAFQSGAKIVGKKVISSLEETFGKKVSKQFEDALERQIPIRAQTTLEKISTESKNEIQNLIPKKTDFNSFGTQFPNTQEKFYGSFTNLTNRIRENGQTDLRNFLQKTNDFFKNIFPPSKSELRITQEIAHGKPVLRSSSSIRKIIEKPLLKPPSLIQRAISKIKGGLPEETKILSRFQSNDIILMVVLRQLEANKIGRQYQVKLRKNIKEFKPKFRKMKISLLNKWVDTPPAPLKPLPKSFFQTIADVFKSEEKILPKSRGRKMYEKSLNDYEASLPHIQKTITTDSGDTALVQTFEELIRKNPMIPEQISEFEGIIHPKPLIEQLFRGIRRRFQ